MRRLSERQGSIDPNLLLGLDAPDDAAVYRVSDDLALVQTVDFFTPVVDDPYDWGAIAVANALSDIYAMGGRPLLGLNLVGWPQSLDLGILASVLEGGADKAQEGGTAIIGGHTIDDPEPKFGMAVTGTVHPQKIMKKSTASPGMSIVLSKPLGAGIVSTALKRGQADPQIVSRATGIMTTLNDGAAAAMEEVGAGAATDVTGFGLLGHLHGMTSTSGLSAEIWADEVPVQEGVFELAAKDLVPGGTRRNEDHFGAFVEADPAVDRIMQTILFDAQTSGGLLIAVEQEKEEALLAALERHSTPARSVIGRFFSGSPGKIKVLAGRSD